MSHVYGPHRPEDEPSTGVVWDVRGRRRTKAEIPLTRLVLDQRRAINERTHRGATQ